MIDISVEQTKELIEKGAVILDVREQYEYDEGHIDNSILIPLGDLQSRMSELDKSKTIIAVCRSGARSNYAAKMLQKMGFEKVHSMMGGMLDWY